MSQLAAPCFNSLAACLLWGQYFCLPSVLELLFRARQYVPIIIAWPQLLCLPLQLHYTDRLAALEVCLHSSAIHAHFQINALQRFNYNLSFYGNLRLLNHSQASDLNVHLN
jgi:hypothetical protein